MTQTYACTYSGAVTVSDQVVDQSAVNQVITVDFGTSGDCSSFSYSVATSPSPAPGGALVVLSGAGPSIEVTQNGNVDSFAVAVGHYQGSDVVVYTSFLVHPYDSSMADFSTNFCTAYSSSCMCTASCTGTATDFCSSHLFLEPTLQTEFVYQIWDSPVPVDYALNPFTMHTAQHDYGCPVDLYTLEVDYNGGGFSDSLAVLGVTLDANTPKVTVSISDSAKASDLWTYRLVYNGAKYIDFNPSGCYIQLPTNFMATPTPSFNLVVNEVPPTLFTFESYANTGGAACSALTYGMQSLELWMAWDTSGV